MKVLNQHARFDMDRAVLYSDRLRRLGFITSIKRLGIYWDISSPLPAAQAGKSYQLVHLTANEVRKQLDAGKQQTISPLAQKDLSAFTTKKGYGYDLYGRRIRLESQ